MIRGKTVLSSRAFQFKFLLENYQQRLGSKGVPQGVIDYLETISDVKIRGDMIARLMSNPRMSVEEISKLIKAKRDVFRHPDLRTHNMILAADPTPNKIYYKIIHDWYEKFLGRLEEDRGRILLTLDHYNKFKSKYKTSYIHKYKTFQDLEKEYHEIVGRVKTHKLDPSVIASIKGIKKLKSYNGYDIYEITSVEGAKYMGKMTSWCTSTAEPYFGPDLTERTTRYKNL